MSKARVITALASAMALLLAGCDSEAAKDEGMNAMFSELMKRPDIESMQTDYLALLEQIRKRLIKDIGIKPFIPDDDGIGGSACPGELSAVDEGEVRYYRSGRSPGNISDADWPRALKVVTEITGPKGFDTPQVVVERPRDHEVAIYDKYGAELIFGTAKNTILSLNTGCHLTREAHERGAPAPEEPLY